MAQELSFDHIFMNNKLRWYKPVFAGFIAYYTFYEDFSHTFFFFFIKESSNSGKTSHENVLNKKKMHIY